MHHHLAPGGHHLAVLLGHLAHQVLGAQGMEGGGGVGMQAGGGEESSRNAPNTCWPTSPRAGDVGAEGMGWGWGEEGRV
jgi:hypothetical protein